MNMEEVLSGIERAETVEELRDLLQEAIAAFGFESFAFVDVGDPTIDRPFFVATTDRRWDSEYQSHDLVHSDPVIPIARRTNTPFTWDSVYASGEKLRRKSGAKKVMDAAFDHGFKNGLVIPVHFVDRMGRRNSASCGFFWKDRLSQFKFVLHHHKYDLHLMMLYWAQRVVDLADDRRRHRRRFTDDDGKSVEAIVLTGRERDVLSWAARGKTMSETAEILSISEQTVESYIRQCLRKLGVVNKTHAVATAMFLGLIDI